MRTFDFLFEGIRIAWDALMSNKIRAGLTIGGVAIGVAVVVAMAAVITGIRSSIEGQFEAAGPRNFSVMPFDFSAVRLSHNDGPPWWKNPEISDREVRQVAALPAIYSATAAIDEEVTVTRDGERMRGVAVAGRSSNWESFVEGTFVAGRNFTAREADSGAPVVVISDRMAEELFGPLDPIGQTLRASSGWRGVNARFTVIGVFEQTDNIFGALQPFYMMMPYHAAIRRLKVQNPFNFASIVVVPRDEFEVEVAKDQVIGAMRSMRGLRPADENNFGILQFDQLLEMFNRFTGAFFAVMLGLSSVALMVGGVGVIGIMLISVTERTREIGVRKAVGATRSEILWQFLVEAAVLTSFGGAVGLGLGALVSWGVASFSPIPALIPMWSIVAALAAAAFTGMVFGLIPAVRAAKLEPVAALRFE